ncbi:hypothetical protein [Dehalobacterium formicoaceticum]|uniref:hypothetical protein n=1 Tax=Dehalobacterium formicoaceticum TaxID=51515 RepID=UPI0031F60CC2
MKSKSEQAAEFKAILDKYDLKTQKLYNEILRIYSNEAPHLTKTAMRNKILDMVKEASK